MAWFHSLLTSGGNKFTKIDNVVTMTTDGYHTFNLPTIYGLTWGTFEELYVINETPNIARQGVTVGIMCVKAPAKISCYSLQAGGQWVMGRLDSNNLKSDLTFKPDASAESSYNTLMTSQYYLGTGKFSVYYR